MTGLFDHLPGQQQEHDQPQERSRRQHLRRRRRRARRARSLVLIAAGLAVVLGAGLLGFRFVKPLYNDWRAPKDYAGPGIGSVTVQVDQGESGVKIAAKLAELGVVRTAGAFSSAARANPASSSIQPGTYKLKKEMSSQAALAALLSEDARISIRVQLPEGLRASEALTRISSATGFSVAQLRAAAKTPSAGLPAAAKGNPEGYLYPATYSLNPGQKPAAVIKEMVDSYKKAMSSAGVPAAQQRRVLTLASIVQGEAADAGDMPKVARVFTNRLDKGMALQSDLTVHYANNVKPSVTTTEAMRKSSSPYNTYKYPGLTPGPINSPGIDAIKAAYKPVAGPWLYFVAVNPETGETRFATTAAGHQKNVAVFQKWLRENPSGN